MKKILWLLIVSIAFTATTFAQLIPQGMKYQAVARNLKGEILANEQIILKIALTSQQNGAANVHYSEIHNIKTNELGLFTLVIGEGAGNKSTFKEIPWSSQNIWMEVAIADKDKGGFTIISSSKLLAVPYAFHAETANKISGNVTSQGNKEGPTPSATWSTKGNSGIMVGDYLGTSDNQSLFIKTNGLERMNVLDNGDVNVKGNVNLNTASGATVNNGNFTVANTNATNLTGILDVTGATHLKNTLTTDGAADLKSTLDVTGATYLKNTLTTDGITNLLNVTESNTTNDGALVVEGGVGIEKNLNVGGNLNVTGLATLKNLAVDGVTGKSINIMDDNIGYLATFNNTNNLGGDGIKIQLGKEHPLYPSGTSVFTLPTLPNPFPSTTTKFQNYINTHPINFQAGTLLSEVSDGLLGDLGNYAQAAASQLCDLTNLIIDKVNEGLGLTPNGKVLLPQTDILLNIFTGINKIENPDTLNYCDGGTANSVADAFIPDEFLCPSDDLYVGGKVVIPEIKVPKIPNIPVCPENPLNLSFDFTLPWNAVSDPLTNSNEFVGFFDKNGIKCGAIRGESAGEWLLDYFDVPFVISTVVSIANRIDLDNGVFDPTSKYRIFAQVIEVAANFVSEFGKMGVEYSSGNGDYAEWLERVNPKESISYGDIVAVKGGKITKDLNGAEQIMAVSHRPIVLGNVPEKEKISLGNNIAFMGQIPVKIMGPVKAGDYIVAKSEIQGYGVAVDPLNMQVEDYKLAVGRSWTTDENKGPKMVKTVVGVHNNDFLNIVKRLKDKVEENDERLKAIEAKLNISPGLEGDKVKKAFK